MSSPRHRRGHWTHFEHGADIGLRAEAADRESLFQLMAEALTAVITEPRRVRPEIEITVSCEAEDDGMLLVDWLNTLIYEMATRNMLFSSWRVRLDGNKLSAVVAGEALSRAAHEPVVEVKGATYTALECRQRPDGRWIAQCVVDV